ncbi:MAG: hypothetical protein JOY77_03345 [Alphaproteobacteria bacterium]|nr:hypothetical protein [Alphaproteobacteria bacterium]MBV9061948.1 hypothetical protein [Alphaproteobacteria bacterium]
MKSVSTGIAALAFAALAAQADAKNLVVNGNFEQGNQGFSSEYTPVDEICAEQEYIVGADPSLVNCYGDWASFGDHTTGSGLMLILNGALSPGAVLWSQTIPVQAGTNYMLKYFGATVVKSDFANAPTIQAYFNGTAVGKPLVLPVTYDGRWHGGKARWNSGSATSVTITLVDTDTAGAGNDFAIDDIKLMARP